MVQFEEQQNPTDIMEESSSTGPPKSVPLRLLEPAIRGFHRTQNMQSREDDGEVVLGSAGGGAGDRSQKPIVYYLGRVQGTTMMIVRRTS
jgi:hypothetical protein